MSASNPSPTRSSPTSGEQNETLAKAEAELDYAVKNDAMAFIQPEEAAALRAALRDLREENGKLREALNERTADSERLITLMAACDSHGWSSDGTFTVEMGSMSAARELAGIVSAWRRRASAPEEGKAV